VGSAQQRILVVDDSTEIRELFQVVLESAGYDVQVAAEGQEGLEVTRRFRPHLIVTDVSMPGMDGFEFLVRLRSDFPPPLPPVLVCSGFDVTADRALRLGALRFVAKPVEPATLLKIVEQALCGQAGDPESLAQEWAFARAARARTAETAARLMAGTDVQDPELVRKLTQFVQWVSDYFGYAEAAGAVVQGSKILVPAVSRNSLIPAGMRFSGKGLYTTGVLTVGSTLVLADASSLPLFADPKAGELGIGFLVAVPLVFQGVPCGALSLHAGAPHSFAAEDSLILEQLGRFGARGFPTMLQRFHKKTLKSWNVCVLSSAVFDRLLAAELAILHRERGGLDLVFVKVDPASLPADWSERFLGRTRFALCLRDSGTVAIFKRDSTATAASDELVEALDELRTVATVEAVGWVSLAEEGLTPVPSQVMLQLARVALDQARSVSGRPIQRIVIRPEGWPATSPHG
jgi:CheY-like chemotaxis protein